MVSIDNYYEGRERAENIGLQDFEGGFKMGNYLIENGMKKILFLSDNDIGVDHERWLGLQRAAKENGSVLAETLDYADKAGISDAVVKRPVRRDL